MRSVRLPCRTSAAARRGTSSTCSALNPGSTLVRRRSCAAAAPRRPAARSRAPPRRRASPLRTQRPPREPLDDRPPSLSTSPTLVREACQAGARPKSMPVTTDKPARTRSTVPSMATSSTRGMLPALSVRIGAIAQYASSRPSAPAGERRAPGSRPASAARAAAVRRRARSGWRSPCSRTDARTSSRLATFAQAIRTTTPTARAASAAPAGSSPTICSCSRTTSADSFALLSGTARARRSAIVLHLRVAPARSSTPGLSRATTPRKCAPRGGVRGLERQRPPELGVAATESRSRPASRRRSSTGLPLSDRVRPMTPGSPPKRRCHMPWLRTMTRFFIGHVLVLHERAAERRRRRRAARTDPRTPMRS